MKIRTLFILIVALLFFSPADAYAGITYGRYIAGLYKSFYAAPVTGGFVIAGLAFDPTSKSIDGEYDRIYFANRSTDTGTRGIYFADIYNATYSGRLALTSLSEPYGCAVDSIGNVYVCYYGTSAVYKVANASGGNPVVTQMLGNYGFSTGEDDPMSIALVPKGFGGSYDAGVDLILFDAGLDNDANEAVSVVQSTSLSTNQQLTAIWRDLDGVNNDIRGTVSSVDGFAYIIRMAIPTAESGSGVKPYINRINASGILQRVFINVSGNLSSTLDDSITVNPVDGSIWFVVSNYGGVANDRAIYRIDAANTSSLNANDYIANTTLEIALTGTDSFNIGVNDLAFSPDGRFLTAGCPSGQDKLYVYTAIANPAPVNCLQAIQDGYTLDNDFNGDCKADFKDLAMFLDNWLDCLNPADADCNL
jgi:hypothetical protein